LWVGLQPDVFPARCHEHRRPEGRPAGRRVCGSGFSPTPFHRDAMNMFGLSRNKIRELAFKGDIPGVVKASW
jgi:ribosomal protein S14